MIPARSDGNSQINVKHHSFGMIHFIHRERNLFLRPIPGPVDPG